MSFAEEKLHRSGSGSEEDLEPWDQPADGDAPPAPDAEPLADVALDRPTREATVQRQEQMAERPVLDGVRHQSTQEGTVPPRGQCPGGKEDLLIEAMNFAPPGP